MKYSLEALAQEIQDEIEFEECVDHVIVVATDDKTYVFEDIIVGIECSAVGHVNGSGESVLTEVVVSDVFLYEIPSMCMIKKFTPEEEAKLEKLISW